VFHSLIISFKSNMADATNCDPLWETCDTPELATGEASEQ